MNTDKIYAEQLANEYAPKDTSKVVALRKLDKKAKLPANIFTYSLGILSALVWHWNVPWNESYRKRLNGFFRCRNYHWHYRHDRHGS